MLTIRRAEDRGHFDHGWLDTYHSFSFAGYHDPDFMGFRALRVINEDRVMPGRGFGEHGHSDMEIITYVVEGALAHKDSLGHESVLKAGEFQRMTAGTGVRHSEFNASQSGLSHFLQIWIKPAERSLEPSYEQKAFPVEQRLNEWRTIASPSAENGALLVHQDARLLSTVLEPGKTLSAGLSRGRHGWLQVVRGQILVNAQSLKAGDGLAISAVSELSIQAQDQGAELLFFDLA